jgi:hypothetical protein
MLVRDRTERGANEIAGIGWDGMLQLASRDSPQAVASQLCYVECVSSTKEPHAESVVRRTWRLSGATAVFGNRVC